MVSTAPNTDEYVDTLRISKSEWRAILTQLERDAQDPTGRDKRRDQRKRYRAMMTLLIKMLHPGGTRITYLVRTRNLSNTGLGFLHGGYLHSGTRCTLALTALDGTPCPISGKIVRCRHLQGKVHEVGIRFERPINLEEYTTPTDRVD
jgi:hypothetical protein